MNTDFNKAINRVIEMSAAGGLTGTYDNKVIYINFKVDETFELDVNEDIYRLSYITEVHASPAEIKFKVSDVKEVKHFTDGEFEPCPFCEVIQLFFIDGSQLEFFEDYR